MPFGLTVGVNTLQILFYIPLYSPGLQTLERMPAKT